MCRKIFPVLFIAIIFFHFSQDYLVLLPKEYYQPTNLKLKISDPCEAGSDAEFCVQYTYPRLREDDFITVEAEYGKLFGPKVLYPNLPFIGVVLTGSQVWKKKRCNHHWYSA